MLQIARTSRRTPSAVLRQHKSTPPAPLHSGALAAGIAKRSLWTANSSSGRTGLVALELTRVSQQRLRWQSTQTQRSSTDNPAGPDVPPYVGSSSSSKISGSDGRSSPSTTRGSDEVTSASSTSEKGKEKESLDVDSKSGSSVASSSKQVAKPQEPLMTRVWAKVKHEAHHYWSGTKLLGKEIRISYRLQMKLLRGKGLTRREKRQVCRTLFETAE